MKCRKNVKNLSQTEKDKFVNAVLALKAQDSVLHPGSQSRYDDFTETHLLAMHDMDTHAMRPESWGHVGSVFLPWHRELLYRFEKLLQDVDPDVTIPYWDWTRAQATGDDGYPFTHDFLGIDGDDGDEDRVKQEAGAPSPYPHAFDPEAWSATITVVDPDDPLDFFQRAFGEFNIAGTSNDAPNLPENDVNVTGTSTNYRAAINAANTYLTLRSRSEDLHNLVHRYVGGNMLRMTSPNDPIFFLHHAAIDRMWSIWQEKVAAGTDLYVQSSSTLGHKLNDAMLYNEPGDPAPFTTGATPANVIDGHAMHGDGVWYESDIPEIEDPAPSLDFIDIPEGLISYKAVKFKIKGCREVRFRITGAPTGNFGLTSMGTEFTATPVEEDDFFYGYVWVQLAAVAGAIPNSSVDIHAYLIDDEGYYAATEGGEYPLGDYSVTVTGTTEPRENNAVALVLDRSGSMAANAGGTSTRSQLLVNAIGVFRDLMQPNDEVAVVTFDDVVDAPIGMQTVSGAPAFDTVDLTPRNETWIGGGILEGAAQLTAATHTNKSMIVLTDGNQNVHPYIDELPAGTVTNRTYAIGFGLPGQVSDEALNDITSNTDGDLIITGNISTEEQRFNLTKYFVQMLVGVTNSDIILDPNGKLYFGSKDVIPFKISDADVYVDAIALCPIPQYLDFVLETPGGQLIKPSSVEPNVKYIMGRQVICYRMVLPALASDAAGSHGGTWKAILALKGREEIAKLMRNQEFAATAVSPRVDKYLPYSFIVHATSNVRLKAWKVQKSFGPGSDVQLYAALTAYDVPMNTAAGVWAEVTTPDQTTSVLKLERRGEGIYTSSFITSKAGVYKFRIRAEGYTQKGLAFTREKTLTAGVYYGGHGQSPPDRPDKFLCELLHCLFGEHKVLDDKAIERLREMGVDVKQLIDCMKKTCTEKEIKRASTNQTPPKIQRIAQVKFNNAGASKAVPVPASPKKKMRMKTPREKRQDFVTMFLPLDLEKEEKKSAAEPDQKQGKKAPHKGHNK
jgi:hypothetical protein